ncbi:TonB-dependent siderophore receptor [Rhodopseudomonas sp. RCAM05734]|uniref:TonB-dependent siderophore receptor n=1 Tax=Rhodopseudomonas sp. RCAM05734 TaxID=3457549 RepID=UPI004044078D
MTTQAARRDGRLRHSFSRRAPLLAGAAFLLGDLSSGAAVAQAQSGVALPAVTVDAPTQKKRPAQAAAAPVRSASRAAARRQTRNIEAAEPTPTERAIAAAAAKYEQILGYRAMPSATTLRGVTSPLDAAQTVNVVPEQVIKDQLPRNLDDALVNISGVTQANTLGGSMDAVMRRGFGDNRDGSIMRNGMPLVQSRSLNAAVESVEVLKGPASMLYGVIDPGGVVNTISKRPDLYQHGSVSVMGSTYGGGKDGGNAAFDLTGPIGKDGLAYRFIAYGVNEDYWRNFGRTRETLIAPSLAWYGDATTVHLNFEHREFLYPFDRGTLLDTRTKQPLAIPATRRIDEPFDNTWGVSDLIQASVEHRFNADWKLNAAYSYNAETSAANRLRTTAVNPVTGVATRSNDGTGGSLSQDSYGTAYVQGGFWLGEMRNEVLFGGDAQYRVIYRKDLYRQNVSSVFNVYNPVYGLISPGTTVSPADSEQTDKLATRALFFQDTLHLTNQLALVGGVRYMQFEQLAGKGRPFVTNTDLTGDKVLPLGGIIYKLTDQVSLYASYTQSLKPTSTIAAFSSSLANFVVGSNLPPEEGTQWETGVRFDINKRLSGTVALYDIEKKNVLVTQLNTGTGLLEARAAGKVRSRGVEVDVTGKLTDGWSMIGSYAYTDARVTEDPVFKDNALQNVALNTGSLYLVYDFGTTLPGRLRLGAGGHYVGDRPGDAANSFVLPSYAVADAFATYETKYQNLPVTYRLNVKNIFDKVYYPSAASSIYVAVGDARRFSLSATVAF